MPSADLPELGHLGFWARPERERVAAFARLRRLDAPQYIPFRNRAPFARSEDGFHAIVRHADVVEASRAPHLFGNEPNAASFYDLPPWLARYLDSMINMDGPRHSRIRKVVARAFTPRLLAGMEADLRSRAGRIIDDLIADGAGDFVPQVAQRLPVEVVCAMLGLSEDDHEVVARHSNTMVGFNDPEYSGMSRTYLLRHGSPGLRHIIPLSARMMTAGRQLTALVRRVGRERIREPRDDLISALVHNDVDGDRLSPREIGTLFILLVLAGNETTRTTIAHALTLLTEHPEQREILLADFEGRIAGAVEEVVRHSSPVIQFRRTATQDCELGGHPIAAGDKLLLFYNSANRDEAVFRDPDAFDITRSPQRHLGFGGPGPHFCLGANLARQEVTVMLRELLTRLPTIRAVGEPDRLLSYFNNGITHMRFEI